VSRRADNRRAALCDLVDSLVEVLLLETLAVFGNTATGLGVLMLMKLLLIL
jgi:hypothetical protein